jgi:2-hydroxychromene-2-carboxylate isomerase
MACPADGATPNRQVVEALFRHVWQGGGDPNDSRRLQALFENLHPQQDPTSDVIKTQLRANTEFAAAQGVFGVPTFVLDGRLFWGADALPMLRAALIGEPWFAGPDWDDCGKQPIGATRRPI